jgi:tetratricopeptide (TPR) repeat protein
MHASSLVVDRAQQLAASGCYAEVVEYLGTQARSELEESPSLALLYGTAQSRLGHNDDSVRWLDRALDQARKRDDHAIEQRALNARGAAALVCGQIDEAAALFTQALMTASRNGDFAMTGRCSNNLGIISNLRGRHAEAIGSWEIAVAAFDRAGLKQGVAECHHNLAISYREQGALDRALTEARRAVAEAEAAGDHALWAAAMRGRAEILLERGELKAAQRELDRVREIRSRLPDPVEESEDLRVAAAALVAEGEMAVAERELREVIARAETHGRPHLLADATRDLAVLLRRTGRNGEAQAAARTAHAVYTRLGAEREIRNLAGHEWNADFAAELARALEPLHEAQVLADAGRYTELVAYLAGRTQDEVEQSPMLALLAGIAHSRQGRLDEGRQWAMKALLRARVVGDQTLEVRALNVCGAIALERGGIKEATYFFAQAQDQAMQHNDMASVGRCANNLGIIANMEGDYARAVGAYTRAIGAYQRAQYDRGIAETQHNLGITHREQGQLGEAIRAADEAVRAAERLGDRRFEAQAIAGRAEIRIAQGAPRLAIREAEHALALHRDLKDAVLETEDMRILAVAWGLAGKTVEASAMLYEVIDRATAHERPILVAAAQRDLARLMAREGQLGAAKKVAQAARAAFDRLGATVEIAKLDALLEEPPFAEPTAPSATPAPTALPGSAQAPPP